jgi:hypothetical protein
MNFIFLVTIADASLRGGATPRGMAAATRAAVLRQAAASASTILATASLAAPLAAHSIPPPEMLGNAPGGGERIAVLYTPPSVKGQSTPEQIALAEHLKKTGAKFYGAYWCRFCNMQRGVFGAGGVRALPYVECDKTDAGRQRCNAAEIKAYPTWVLKDKPRLVGVQSLDELKQWLASPASP